MSQCKAYTALLAPKSQCKGCVRLSLLQNGRGAATSVCGVFGLFWANVWMRLDEWLMRPSYDDPRHVAAKLHIL